MSTHICIEDYRTRIDHPTWIGIKWDEFLNALDNTSVEWNNWNVPEQYDNNEPSRRPIDIDLFETQMGQYVHNTVMLSDMCNILRSDEHWAIYYSF